MHPSHCDHLVRTVRRLVTGRETASAEGDLLQAFLDRHDKEAFAALVERHGPMVFGVCQGVLRNRHDAEDAFQATFLVLADKARSIRRQASLGSWLHGVALRVARKALAASVRRQAHAAKANAPTRNNHAPDDDLSWREVHAILHTELAGLPEPFRAPLVLCYLEGLTQDEAARRLGWTATKVKGRLQRGRDLLRVRLERRGLGLAAALGTTMLAGQALAAHVPAALALATVRAAASGAGAAAPGAVASLAHEIATAFGPTRVRTAVALVLLVVPLAGGAMLLPGFPTGDPPVQAQVTAAERKIEPRTDRFGDPLPDGAVSRLGTVRFNHGGRVHGFHITPDARTVVSVGDSSICLWDAATGKERARLPTDSFDCGAPSLLLPDGKTMVILCQRTDSLQTWDLEQGKRTRKLDLTLKRNVWSAYQNHALSSDGSLCATHVNSHVQVWDTASGKELFKLPQAGDAIRAVAFAGTRWLVAADKKQVIDVWEARSGKHVRKFAHGGPLEAIATSPDGRLLATLEHQIHAIDRLLNKDVVHVWDLTTGTQKHSLATPPRSWLKGVQFSADGAFVLGYGIGEYGASGLTFWDAQSGKQVRELPTGGAIATTPDGRYLVGGNGKFSLWNLKTGQRIPDEENGTTFAAKIQLSPSGDRVLTLRYESFSTWDVASGKPLRTVEVPLSASDLSDHCWSPDGRYVVSFADTKSKQVDLLLWDVAAGKVLHTLNLEPSCATAFSADSSLLATCEAGKENLVRIWDVRTGKEARRFKDAKIGLGGLAFSGDGRTLFIAGRRVVAYDTATGAERFSWRVQPPPSSVTLHVAGAPPADENDSFSWRSLAFSPDGTVAFGVLSAMVMPHQRVQDRLALCDARTGKVLRRWSDSGKNARGYEALAFSDDGRLFASSDGDAVHVWEAATCAKVCTLRGHRDEVHSLSFSTGGRRLASAAGDSMVLIWDLALALNATPLAQQPQTALDTWWDDLGGTDAARAYTAIARLAAAPAGSVPFLHKRLKPAPATELQEIRQCIADLGSDEFTVRDKANQRLKVFGPSAATLLGEALQENLPLETRRRVQQLLDSPDSRASVGEPLRTLRALTVLEQAGAPDARRLLQELAGGAPGAWLTQQAMASCQRLAARQEGK
jgi:RNA polymerase sigma factor (sigma-70 family)